MENQEYIIINKTAIQKRIEELEKVIQFYDKVGALSINPNKVKAETELFLLKQILSQSIPLIPEIEKAFDSAREFNSLDGVVDIDVVVGFHSETKDLQGVYINSKDYISNLKLDI